MAEWFKAHAWKACVVNPTEGSNPSLSAIFKSPLAYPMDHRLLEGIWKTLGKSRPGRFAAGAIIGGLFSLIAVAQLPEAQSTPAIWIGMGAVMGILGVAVLELLDRSRSTPPQLQQHIKANNIPPRIADVRPAAVPPPIPKQTASDSEAKP